MNQNDMELLRALCETRGISGREEAVRGLILSRISEAADEVQVDGLGNVLVFKKGRNHARKRVLLSAHMDEVGLIVTHIGQDGLLRFSTVGGIDRRVLCGKPVTVGDQALPGVIGLKPIHLLQGEEKEKSVPVEDLYIDIGAKDREQAEKLVQLGDMVCFAGGFDASAGKIRAKALDDRAGCAILIKLLLEEHPFDLYFSFVVQEEVGLRGARAAVFTLEPEAAIVVEATTAADIPGVEEAKQVCRVGGGAVLSFMDRSTIYDSAYYRLAQKSASAVGAPWQAKQAVAGGNDAGAIHQSRGGVRTAAVSLPCRYLHSPVSLIAQEDFDAVLATVRELSGRMAGGQ
jgi:putative aminopeptidase FrvX